MIVTHKHMRKVKFCNKGGREFFDKHGLDWADFVKNGIPEEKLIETGDAMAKKVVDQMRSENGQ